MAFLRAAIDLNTDTSTRFSLLLLEHGEVYFEDVSVNMFLGFGSADVSRGRLRICSHSLLFDPLDETQPLLKFPFRKLTALTTWRESKFSNDVLLLVTKDYVRIRSHGKVIQPYEFLKSKEPLEFRFSPNYVSLVELLHKVSRLHRGWTEVGTNVSLFTSRLEKEHESNIEFNTCWMEDITERIVLRTVAKRVLPLVTNRGRVMLTSERLYFQPFNNIDSEPVRKYTLSSIYRVIKRRYLLRNVGIELYFRQQGQLYLAFDTHQQRDAFYDGLVQQPSLVLEVDDQINMMLKWQNGLLSNADYLLYLNSMADRSFNDLTQYPVFPWVVADYKSEKLDLHNPATFRDLSKPIGALNPERLQMFLKRYVDMPEPRFLYGSHYSTPGYVLYYTLRVAPEYSLCLQNGKYDVADRLFTNMAETWEGVLTGAADVKELIPEFYTSDGSFLINSLGLDLGTTQSGVKVDDVRLPPWASSAPDMIEKLREALESPYVSENLHHWIDLIFGYKQRGNDAVNAKNVFYWLTYEGAVDLETIDDPATREAYEAQILEFGQTPKQLFTIPHPARRATASQGNGASAQVLPPLSMHLSAPPTPYSAAPPKPQSPFSFSPVSSYPSMASPRPSAQSPGPQSASALASASASASGLTPMSPGPTPMSAREVAAADNNEAWARIRDLHMTYSAKLHKDYVTSVLLADNGKTVYSVGKDSFLKVQCIATESQMHSVQIGDLALSSCVILPDSKLAVLGSWDNSIYVYSVEYGRIVDSWQAHDDAVSALALTRNGLLISASWDSTIKVWSLSDLDGRPKHRLVAELTEHDGEVRCISLHEDRRYLASGGADGLIIVWDLDSYSMRHRFHSHADCVHALTLMPDGRRMISVGADHCLKVFDLHQGTETVTLDTGDELHCFVSNGQFVLAGGESGSMHVWDLLTGSLVCSFPDAHRGPITCMQLQAKDFKLVVGSQDKYISVWTL
eukprot:m.13881 g.13881  ORF g.13881 m.13881 type:complete len:966 (-) comp6991_c0_seq1:1490-4387(-)